MINVFYLYYFVIFSFGIRFEINFKILGSATAAAEIVLINILRNSLDLYGTVN